MSNYNALAIRDSLVKQKYQPRNTVFAHTGKGRVDIVVYNIQGGMTIKDSGKPMARFEATRDGKEPLTIRAKVYDSLSDALAWIGVPAL
jgi:hypothetical protein